MYKGTMSKRTKVGSRKVTGKCLKRKGYVQVQAKDGSYVVLKPHSGKVTIIPKGSLDSAHGTLIP